MGKFVIEKHNGESIWRLYENEYGDIAGEEAYLTPYTEPDLEQVRKEAYEDGYKTAKVQCNIQAEKDLREVGERHYKKGLSDAWEAARKICGSVTDGGLNHSTLNAIFGSRYSMSIMHRFTASEATEKIRQYAQKQKKIKVGDEVENTQTGVKFIVTHIWFNNHGEKGVSGFNHNRSAFSTTIELVKKTGRHFPEIAAVLEKMRGEQDE